MARVGILWSAGVSAGILLSASISVGATKVWTLLPAGSIVNTSSYAQGINNAGVVVGYSGAMADYPTIWQPGTTNYAASFLPTLPGNPTGAANAINSSGLIVGYGQPTTGDTATAVAWTPGSSGYTATALPSPGGTVMAGAYAVNATGQAAGFASDASQHSIPLLWSPSTGGYQSLQLPLLPGQTDAVATAVNDDGDVAGYAIDSTGITGAVWVAANNYAQQKAIANDSALITGMNRWGTGVGVYGGNLAMVMGYYNGDFYAMNLPPYGVTDSASDAVNANDDIVGYAKDPTTGASGREAALWLPTDTAWNFVNLNSYVHNFNWTLQEATSISDNGLVAGYGTYQTRLSYGFVVDVSPLLPEPSLAAAALLATAVGLVGRRRRT